MKKNLAAIATVMGLGAMPEMKETATVRRTRKRRIANHPPVSMSEGTAYLYSKKPNIQFWQNKYGEKVIDKSVIELQEMGI